MASAASVPVRISTELANQARQEAETFGRSMGSQIEHWAALGRIFEALPGADVPRLRRALQGELDPSEITDSLRVRDALLGQLPVEELDEGEQELFYDLFGLVGPSEQTRAIFAERRQRGGGVGLNEQGQLVRGVPGGGTEPHRGFGRC